MAKKDKLRDVLTKVNQFFPQDIYIVDGRWIVQGDKSYSLTPGTYMLDTGVNPIRNELYAVYDIPVDELGVIIHIDEIRKGKDDLLSYGHKVTDEDEIKKVMELLTGIQNTINDVNDNTDTIIWGTMDFTEEELNILYKAKGSVTKFANDNTIPDIEMTKSLFPGFTEKTVNNIKYAVSNVDDFDGLKTIYMFYANDMFDIFMSYAFFSIDSDEDN